jgi:hypothetical protein
VRWASRYPFDGANIGLEAGQIELLDHAPNLARGVIVVDQTLDIEGFEPKLLAVHSDIAGDGRRRL